MEKILVINLGGTSSKVALYFDEDLQHEKTIRHSSEQMNNAKKNIEQVAYRKKMILEWFEEIAFDSQDITSVAVRGGNIPREFGEKGGTYLIDDFIKKEIFKHYNEDDEFFHGVIASPHVAMALIGDRDVNIYVTDPPTVDEMAPVAKIAGHPKFHRTAVAHNLNQRAVARKVASELGKKYEDTRLIVAHLGAGISIGTHRDGKIIDINNCTRGDGPMSPDRAGQLPMGQLIDMCFTGEYDNLEMQMMIRGNGGVKAYLGTSDMREVEEMIAEGNEEAELIWNAVVYQVAKEIGSAVTVLDGKVDKIVYTGGIANSKKIIEALNKKVGSFAPTQTIPGEFENEGLALGALRVIRGEEELANYHE